MPFMPKFCPSTATIVPNKLPYKKNSRFYTMIVSFFILWKEHIMLSLTRAKADRILLYWSCVNSSRFVGRSSDELSSNSWMLTTGSRMNIKYNGLNVVVLRTAVLYAKAVYGTTSSQFSLISIDHFCDYIVDRPMNSFNLAVRWWPIRRTFAILYDPNTADILVYFVAKLTTLIVVHQFCRRIN